MRQLQALFGDGLTVKTSKLSSLRGN